MLMLSMLADWVLRASIQPMNILPSSPSAVSSLAIGSRRSPISLLAAAEFCTVPAIMKYFLSGSPTSRLPLVFFIWLMVCPM